MKRKRNYACEVFSSKRDALAEASIIRKIGHKATVKRNKGSGGGFKVCRLYKR